MELGYGYRPKEAQCYQFALTTLPVSEERTVFCNVTRVQLDKLSSNTEYQVFVKTVAVYSELSQSSRRETRKAWTRKFCHRFIYYVIISRCF